MSRVSKNELRRDRVKAKREGEVVQRFYHGPEGLRIRKCLPSGEVVKSIKLNF